MAIDRVRDYFNFGGEAIRCPIQASALRSLYALDHALLRTSVRIPRGHKPA
jgi:hypothetical protein